MAKFNPVAKHAHKYNKPKVYRDRKKESKKNPPEEFTDMWQDNKEK